jgi:predicted RNase H-like nuclease (RuvC/YqgF family)
MQRLEQASLSTGFEKLQVKDADMELQSKVSRLEVEIRTLQQENRTLQQENRTLQQQVQTLHQQLETYQSVIDQLLANAELQFKTRRRILIQESRKKLLRKLGLQKEDAVTWEDFIKNLSLSQKVALGVSAGVLQLLGSGMRTLNIAIHTSDNLLEIAHAMNNVQNMAERTTWRDAFIFCFERNPEDVEF